RRGAEPGMDSMEVSLTTKLENSKYNRYRSARFADFGEALSVLQREGVAGVRLGAKVERDYTGDLPNLIDYAAHHRRALGPAGDFFDIYLMAHCRFYIGTGSGLTALSLVFKRPMAFVNNFPWPWGDQLAPIEGSVYLPKLWRRRDGRMFTFGEMISLAEKVDW